MEQQPKQNTISAPAVLRLCLAAAAAAGICGFALPYFHGAGAWSGFALALGWAGFRAPDCLLLALTALTAAEISLLFPGSAGAFCLFSLGALCFLALFPEASDGLLAAWTEAGILGLGWKVSTGAALLSFAGGLALCFLQSP